MPLVRSWLTYICLILPLFWSNIQFDSFVGLLTLTVGRGDNAREIFEESVNTLDEYLTSKSDARKIPSVSRSLDILECLVFKIFLLIILRHWFWIFSGHCHLRLQFMECLATVTFVGGNDQEETQINGHIAESGSSQIRFRCRHPFQIYLLVLFAYRS